MSAMRINLVILLQTAGNFRLLNKNVTVETRDINV